MAFTIVNKKNKIIDLHIDGQDDNVYGIRTEIISKDKAYIGFGMFYNSYFTDGNNKTISKCGFVEISQRTCVRNLSSELNNSIKSGFGLFCLDTGVGFGMSAYPAMTAYYDAINEAIYALDSENPEESSDPEFDEIKSIASKENENSPFAPVVKLKQHIGFGKNEIKEID